MYFRYGALTLLGMPSQTFLLYIRGSGSLLRASKNTLQPQIRNGLDLGTYLVWADPASLVATRGISIDFFSFLT